MKIYTRRGDRGESDLPGGARVWKNSPLLEAVGTLDELNAAIGLVRAEQLPETIDRLLERLQNELFNAGAELVSGPRKDPPVESAPTMISKEHILAIETAIDQFDAKLRPLKGFILPGGTRIAAMFHIARTICRKAERRLAALVQVDGKAVSGDILAYVNRLSDLFFILARDSNDQAGVADILWK